jgi:transposase-like protein
MTQKRKRLSRERISAILRDYEGYDGSIRSFCKERGISEQNFYRWKRHQPHRDIQPLDIPLSRKLSLAELEQENQRLKIMLAELLLERSGSALTAKLRSGKSAA